MSGETPPTSTSLDALRQHGGDGAHGRGRDDLARETTSARQPPLPKRRRLPSASSRRVPRRDPATWRCAITSAFMLGDTMICPPAPATARTSSLGQHRSGPDDGTAFQHAREMADASSGSGEFSGTSMIRMPAETSAWPTPAASSGRMPAQDGDQGALRESCIEGIAGGEAILSIARQVSLGHRFLLLAPEHTKSHAASRMRSSPVTNTASGDSTRH